MKKIIMAITVLAITASLCACSEKNNAADTATTTPSATTSEATTLADIVTEPADDKYSEVREKLSEDDLCAVAYLGGCKSADEVKQTVKNSSFAAEYAFVAEIPDERIVQAEAGWDVYCIIPKHSDAQVSVKGVALDENAELSETDELYSGAGEPILLYCNISDILPNALVTVSCHGKTVSFNPHLSARDGSLVTAENGVYNFAE